MRPTDVLVWSDQCPESRVPFDEGQYSLVGSDWIWELQMPGVAREPALRRVHQLAAELDLHPQRPDGHINLFSNLGAGLRTVSDLDAALTALAGGAEHGQSGRMTTSMST